MPAPEKRPELIRLQKAFEEEAGKFPDVSLSIWYFSQEGIPPDRTFRKPNHQIMLWQYYGQHNGSDDATSRLYNSMQASNFAMAGLQGCQFSCYALLEGEPTAHFVRMAQRAGNLREWIEQVVNSKVHPRIGGIRTAQFPNGRGGSVVVVTVPASQAGPHQAPDKRYYKRFDLQSVAMEDYEIRDVLNRAVTPELYVKPGFQNGWEQRLEFKSERDVSEAFPWLMWIGNRSKAPAEYARVILGLDADFVFIGQVGFGSRGLRTLGGAKYQTFDARWSVLEQRFPIFKETDFPLSEEMMLAVRERHIHSTLFRAFIGIQAPGFSSIEHYNITCQNAVLTIRGPLTKD